MIYNSSGTTTGGSKRLGVQQDLINHMKKLSYRNNFGALTMKTGLSDNCYRFFSTLANPTRLAILELLLKGPRNVTQIAKALKQEQSMISHNLRLLVRCGFLFVEQKWKERIYQLNSETIEPLFHIISHHTEKFCPFKGACKYRAKKKKTNTASRN
jgi:ArsR family transcriptional regulator